MLDLARELEWDFPSSAGRPLRDPAQAEPLLSRRDELAEVARQLDDEHAAELAGRTWRLWMTARDFPGGREFLAPVLQRRVNSRWSAIALYGDGVFAFWLGLHDESRRRNEEALAIARELRDAEALTLAHLGLGRALFVAKDHEAMLEHAAAAADTGAPLGDAMMQGALHIHAQAVRLSGDYEEAAPLFEQSLALNERLDAQGMVDVEHHNLGHVEIHRGNVDAAAEHFAQVPHSDDDYSRAMANLNNAQIAFARGDVERAGNLLEAAEGTFAGSSMGDLAIDDRFELDWLREQLECAAN
jgi:tetratricopeptide (TPR) repeat protein